MHIQGTKEDLEALANPTSNSAAKIFNGSAVFLPAPFLSKAIFNAGTGYPFELILVALKTAEYFDNTHDVDEVYTDKAILHAED